MFVRFSWMSMNVGWLLPMHLNPDLNWHLCVVETDWMEDGREGILGIIM
jgi:hypothetical protein